MDNYSSKKEFGAWGEQLAADYLQGIGYRIIARNYRCRYGEMDLVGKEGDVWCFIEVKIRKSFQYGNGLNAITPVKKRHLTRVALFFLQKTAEIDAPARFDIVSIDYRSKQDYQIELIRNAFE